MKHLKSYLSHRLLGAVIGLGIPVMAARAMPDADYAAYLIALSVAGLVSGISCLGMDRAAYRYLPESLGAPWGRRFLRDYLLFGALLRGGLALLLYALTDLLVQFAMPEIAGALDSHPGWILGLVLSFCLSAFLSEVCSGILLFSAQASHTLHNLLLRVLGLLALYVSLPEITLAPMLILTVLTELTLVAALFGSIVLTLRGLAPATGQTAASAAPSFAALRQASLGAYGGYLSNIPWESACQRVLLGSVAGTQEIAAFGFLQTLADRARLYLPARLLQSAVEPLLADAFARGRPFSDIAAQLNLLRKFNFCLLGAALLLLGVAGNAWLDLVSGNKFGSFAPLAMIIVVQYLSATAITIATASYNALSRLPDLGRVSIAGSLAGLPVLWLAAQHGGAHGIVLANVIQTLLVFLYLRFWRHDPAVTGLWPARQDLPLALLLLGSAALGLALAQVMPAVLASLIALGAYFAGISRCRILGREDLRQLENLMARSS